MTLQCTLPVLEIDDVSGRDTIYSSKCSSIDTARSSCDGRALPEGAEQSHTHDGTTGRRHMRERQSRTSPAGSTAREASCTGSGEVIVRKLR